VAVLNWGTLKIQWRRYLGYFRGTNLAYFINLYSKVNSEKKANKVLAAYILIGGESSLKGLKIRQFSKYR